MKKILPKLKLENIVDLLCTTDVKHLDLPESNDWNGLCSYQQQALYINKNQDINSNRNTVIHELYHAFWGNKGLTHTEKDVEKYTSNLYKQLYERKK